MLFFNLWELLLDPIKVILNCMVVGVVTFFKGSENYGSLLQAYAFQKVLLSRGHSPYLIDVDNFKKKLIRSSLKIFMIDLKDRFLMFLGSEKANCLKKRGLFFKQFINDNLIIGKVKYKDIKDLRLDPPVADCYVVGSDQVWNFNFISDSNIFFLNFGDLTIPRYSYAASFGSVNLPQIIKRRYKCLLGNFTKISVRENNGKNLCQELGFSNVSLVPDPTLLLSKEEWLSLAGSVSSLSQNYVNVSKRVFVYSLGADFKSSFGSELKILKKNSQFNVRHVSSGFGYTGYDDYGDEFPSITNWLKYIVDADFVITNSFHGMVFSIIFEKPFIVVSRMGKSSYINDRIDTFLKKVGLEKCKVSNAEDFRESISCCNEVQIDWGLVREKVNDFRKVGFDFLSSIDL